MKSIDTNMVKLDAQQIESVIERLVPMIAEPKDYEFFRGILYIKAENSSSVAFAAFAANLLKTLNEAKS